MRRSHIEDSVLNEKTNSLKQQFRKFIINFINENKLTQSEFAKIAQISRVRVNLIVNNKIDTFTIDSLVRIVYLLNKDVVMNIIETNDLFCRNYPMVSIRQGVIPEPYSVLIRIGDIGCTFSKTCGKYSSVHEFQFMDTLEEAEEFGPITDQQANDIIDILKKANEEKRHVYVHCNAGLCRSGAVTEVATMLFGFKADPKLPRQPNALVKRKLLEAAGYYSTLFCDKQI